MKCLGPCFAGHPVGMWPMFVDVWIMKNKVMRMGPSKNQKVFQSTKPPHLVMFCHQRNLCWRKVLEARTSVAQQEKCSCSNSKQKMTTQTRTAKLGTVLKQMQPTPLCFPWHLPIHFVTSTLNDHDQSLSRSQTIKHFGMIFWGQDSLLS